MSDSQVTDIDEVVDEPVAQAVPAKRARKVAVEPVATEAVADPAADQSQEKVDIVIHRGEGDMGKQDVFVGLNGYAYQIKRGVKVTVPRGVVDILTNAVETRYDDGKAEEVPRFAFSVMG